MFTLNFSTFVIVDGYPTVPGLALVHGPYFEQLLQMLCCNFSSKPLMPMCSILKLQSVLSVTSSLSSGSDLVDQFKICLLII